MHLSRIRISNFRNFSEFDVQLTGNVVVVGTARKPIVPVNGSRRPSPDTGLSQSRTRRHLPGCGATAYRFAVVVVSHDTSDAVGSRFADRLLGVPANTH